MKIKNQQATSRRQKVYEGPRRYSRQTLTRAALLFVLTFAFCLSTSALPTLAQAGRRSSTGDGKKNEQSKPAETKSDAAKSSETEPRATETRDVEDDDGEAVKVETNLVTLPVVVSDRGGRYVPDLKSEEFAVSEDGAEQKVSFFATVSEPFSVVLLLDTSASTTSEKMRQVQEAAVTFINNLQEGDRVKVVSFDDTVRELCDFTGDHTTLASAIRATRPGKGTQLYDAFDLAFRSLRRLKGRKAIVMLTDGVDWHSDRRTYADNRRAIEESDVVVYPVRFDTRAETEQLARRQQQQGGQSVDLGTIFGGKIPGLPGGTVIGGTRGGRTTTGTRDGGGGDPSRDASRGGDPGNGTGSMPGTVSRTPDEREDESITSLMDRIYKLADDYLNEMANTSGGRLVRADTNAMLPRAFQQIAEELRTQYSLGYYPTNPERSGKYRKIRVRTTRKDVAVRARPGYRK
jgi:VWFA-related protein